MFPYVSFFSKRINFVRYQGGLGQAIGWPAVISPVLQSATLILCALQMVDSFHEPQDPLGKTYPWTHLDTQTTILEQGTVASVAMES